MYSNQFFRLTILLLLLVGCSGKPSAKKSENQTTPKSETIENNTQNTQSEITIYAIGNTMYDMAFEPNVVKAKANSIIKINFVNTGTDSLMIHNILFVEKGKADEIGIKALRAGEAKSYIPDHPAVIAASKLVQPLDSVLVQFKAPAVGSYPFICTYPGHYLKMRGRLIIEP